MDYYTDEDEELADERVVGNLHVSAHGRLSVCYRQPRDTIENEFWVVCLRVLGPYLEDLEAFRALVESPDGVLSLLRTHNVSDTLRGYNLWYDVHAEIGGSFLDLSVWVRNDVKKNYALDSYSPVPFALDE